MESKIFSSWWLNQPNWKSVRQIGSYPQMGVKTKNMFELPPPRFPIKNGIMYLLLLLMLQKSRGQPPLGWK